MTERRLLVLLTGVLVAASVAAIVAGASPEEAFAGWLLLLWGPGFGLAGAAITRQYPSHAVGRLLQWSGLFAALVSALNLAGDVVPAEVAENPIGQGTQIFLQVVWVLPLMLLAGAIARFPDGSWANRASGVSFWIFAASFGLQAPLSFLDPAREGPAWAVLDTVGAGSLLVLVLSVVVHLVASMRSDPVRRRQYAWVLLALGLSAAVWGGVGALAGAPGWLSTGSLLLFPAALVVAITQHRLYEIDRIVSRTVTYAVVIAVLAVLYFGLVVLLRSLVPVDGSLPVALSTLAVAFASFPVARRAQAWVDRRFFRSRYDSAAVVGAFADEVRSTVDPNALAQRTEAVVEDTFQAESVGVWLADA